MATAQYQVLVNWQEPKEQNVGQFETDTDGWVAASGVQLDRSGDKVHSGDFSLHPTAAIANEIVFDGPVGWDTFVFGSEGCPSVGLMSTRLLTNLDIGTRYQVFGWAYIPPDSRHVRLTTSGADYESTTVIKEAWHYLETSFTASAETQTIELYSVFTEGSPGTTGPYLDDFAYKLAGEDITELVFGTRSPLTTVEGRDLPRALSSVATSQAEFEFNNLDSLYSPNNPLSILHEHVPTNAPVQIRAVFEGRMYLLYNGFIDTFVINHELPEMSTLDVQTIDLLGILAATEVSTGLYQNVRTSEALGYLLDEIGWPIGKRKLDVGSTVLDWWWVDRTNALQALNNLLGAEGLPAIAYVDDVGDFVFRNRHHRFLASESLFPVARYQGEDGIATES